MMEYLEAISLNTMCVLDIAQGLLQLPHGTLYMAKGRKPLSCQVLTSLEVTIPAHTQMVLSCRVKAHCKMTCPVAVVEPTRRTVTRQGILVGRCLVNTRPHIPVLLLNPGRTAVTMAAGSSIALLKPLHAESTTYCPTRVVLQH